MGVGKPGDFPKSCPPPPPPLTANICLHNVLLWGKAKEQLGRKCPGMLHPEPNSRAAQLPLPTGHKALRPSPTFPPLCHLQQEGTKTPNASESKSNHTAFLPVHAAPSSPDHIKCFPRVQTGHELAGARKCSHQCLGCVVGAEQGIRLPISQEHLQGHMSALPALSCTHEHNDGQPTPAAPITAARAQSFVLPEQSRSREQLQQIPNPNVRTAQGQQVWDREPGLLTALNAPFCTGTAGTTESLSAALEAKFFFVEFQRHQMKAASQPSPPASPVAKTLTSCLDAAGKFSGLTNIAHYTGAEVPAGPDGQLMGRANPTKRKSAWSQFKHLDSTIA